MPGKISLLSEDLSAVDEVIARRLETSVPLVGEVARYIIAAGGKRLRPSLHLLFCGALSCHDPRRFELAAVIEFIHTATLLHDDVVDESTLRRGRPTANEVFGNPASVLVGDFLYSRAFQMMVDIGGMRIMQILADATNVIAEGEVLQLMNLHDAEINEATYLRVIRSKTAKLFEASARLAAVLSGSSPAVENACATYGRSLGTAFQVVDDILDYEGDPQVLGKNLGDDLREGKATLPVIIAMQRGSAAQATLIRHAILHGAEDAAALRDVVEVIHSTGALELARSTAGLEAQTAVRALETIPANSHTSILLDLAGDLLYRKT